MVAVRLMMMKQEASHEKAEACVWMTGGEGVAAEGDKARDGSDRGCVTRSRDLVAVVSFGVIRKKRMPRQRRPSSSINHLFSLPTAFTTTTTSHASSSSSHHLSTSPARVRIYFNFNSHSSYFYYMLFLLGSFIFFFIMTIHGQLLFYSELFN